MIRDVVSHLALSDNVTFIISSREVPSGVLFQLKNEPSKFIMLCRNAVGDGVYEYKVHTYNKTIEEIDCESFTNLKEFCNSINVDNLIYCMWMNDLVLKKAKSRLSHLVNAKIMYEQKPSLFINK